MKRCASFHNFEFKDNLFSNFFARWNDTTLILSFNKFSKGSMSINHRYLSTGTTAVTPWSFNISCAAISADYNNTIWGRFRVDLRDPISSQGHFRSFVIKSRHQLSCRFSWSKDLGTLCIENWPCRKLKIWRRRLIYHMLRNGPAWENTREPLVIVEFKSVYPYK